MLVRSKWLDIGYILACLWTETKSRSINTQEKNLANIQPSRPHAWSITHVYNQSSLQHEVAFLMNPHLTVQKRRSRSDMVYPPVGVVLPTLAI